MGKEVKTSANIWAYIEIVLFLQLQIVSAEARSGVKRGGMLKRHNKKAFIRADS